MPIVGVNIDSVEAVHNLIATRESPATNVDVRGTPLLLRQMLLAAAVDVPGCGADAAGAGFINDSHLARWLGTLTGWDFVRLFGIGLADAQEKALRRIRLFNEDELADDFPALMRLTHPFWWFDYRTQRWGDRLEGDESLEGSSVDPRGVPADWPPPLA